MALLSLSLLLLSWHPLMVGSGPGEFPDLPALTKVPQYGYQTADLIFFIKSPSCFHVAVCWGRCKRQLWNEFAPYVACCGIMCIWGLVFRVCQRSIRVSWGTWNKPTNSQILFLFCSIRIFWLRAWEFAFLRCLKKYRKVENLRDVADHWFFGVLHLFWLGVPFPPLFRGEQSLGAMFCAELEAWNQ